jgi:hypothetical protein
MRIVSIFIISFAVLCFSQSLFAQENTNVKQKVKPEAIFLD